MTLREALKTINLAEVYQWINDKDNKNKLGDEPKVPIENTQHDYQEVIDYLNKKPVKKSKMPIVVEEFTEDDDPTVKYFDVSYINPNYVEPPKDLKPWGGRAPKGHYNIHLNKYNRRFGFGDMAWKTVMDATLKYPDKLTLAQAVGEVLWELTFYGFEENKTKTFFDGLRDQVKEIKADKKNLSKAEYDKKYPEWNLEEFKKELNEPE